MPAAKNKPDPHTLRKSGKLQIISAQFHLRECHLNLPTPELTVLGTWWLVPSLCSGASVQPLSEMLSSWSLGF